MRILALFMPSTMPCSSPVPVQNDEIYLDSRTRPVNATWTMGRAEDNDFVFDNKTARSVSRHHCVIALFPGAEIWFLTDLDSTCGTWVNGKKLQARTPKQLSVNDRFSLATIPLEFVVLDGPNDTVNEDEEEEEEGPETIASYDPVTLPPSQPSQPSAKTYGDALYTLVSWFLSGETPAGNFWRFLVAVGLVAVIVVSLSLI